MASLLSVIEQTDTFPYGPVEFYWTFETSQRALLGYITPEIARRLGAGEHGAHFTMDSGAKAVRIGNHLDTFEKRNKLFEEIASCWRETDHALAKGWRNELYTIYHPRSEPYVLLERAFSCLLGVVTYGVHITGYVPSSKAADKKLKIWVPTRSATKQTYPGKLDNTVAGGLGYPLGIRENAVKECYEEAGLSKDFVETRLKPVGVVSYMTQPYGHEGHVQPEVEYVCDLEFDSETDNVPTPVDGEAEDFQLLSIDEVHRKVLSGEFKPNCALVLADFMIRHGYLTWENEPNYLEIVCRIHRKLPFSTLN